ARYVSTGKWTVIRGTVADPGAIMYQLQPDSGQGPVLSFKKADDNILFMTDENGNLLVGNDYVSFTLSRQQKK
ncbi:MAG TPA: hypothetical protein VFI06_05495, partial [Chitinophagaceae bacterium]|nr:hypothetical protein [Chitinophagaceae bacterium]